MFPLLLIRLCYAASREGQMLEVFSYVSVERLTPAPAVVLQVSVHEHTFVLLFDLLCFKFHRENNKDGINKILKTAGSQLANSGISGGIYKLRLFKEMKNRENLTKNILFPFLGVSL